MLTRGFYKSIENIQKGETLESEFGSLTQITFQATLEFVYDDPKDKEVAEAMIRESFKSEDPPNYELTIWTVTQK